MKQKQTIFIPVHLQTEQDLQIYKSLLISTSKDQPLIQGQRYQKIMKGHTPQISTNYAQDSEQHYGMMFKKIKFINYQVTNC